MHHRCEHPIRHLNDGFIVRRSALEIAGNVGFPRVACVEIAIAASELCSNIVKYGVSGRVQIEAVEHDDHGLGVRVSAFDRGPPFRDFDRALRDGFEDGGPVDPLTLVGRGGLGAGLGAVQRFSDELGWVEVDGGKEVWMIRYRTRRPARPHPISATLPGNPHPQAIGQGPRRRHPGT